MRGVALLAVRQVLAQALNVVGYVLLARVLAPGDLGVFAIALFTFAILSACGGAGLQPSLVRAPDEPSAEDYRAVFTVQEAIIAAVVLAAWIAAPHLAALYGRPVGEAAVFRLAALALAITSFQAIPSARLERRLDFGAVALVEVAQAFAYNATAVLLVYTGWGTVSVGAALVARAIVGAAIATAIVPWSARPLWSWPRVREHLRIGLPLQGGVLVTQLRDGITPAFIGVVAGTAAVGYVQWAQTVATAPLWPTMILQRVYLPAFARVQHERAELGRFVEQALRATHALVAPGAVLTLVLIEPITRLVFGPQWTAAIPIFVLLWPATLIAPSTIALLALLNAVGDTRTGFAFAVLWALVTWALGVPCVLAFGALGFGLASLGVQATAIALFRRARERAPFRLLPAVAPPWLAAAGAGLAIFVAARVRPCTTVAELAAYGAVGLFMYALGVLLIAPRETRQLLAWMRGRA